MRAKNIYQCDSNCQNCNYINRKPTGYGIMDECATDICPHKNYKIGNVDKLGGRHVEGYGWNPLGEFCNLCRHTSCEDCVKWSNRDKKLRNNIPIELKNQGKQPTQQIEKSQPSAMPTIPHEKPEIKTEEKQQYQPTKSTDFGKFSNTFIDRNQIPNVDDFNFEDFASPYTVKKETINKMIEENMKELDVTPSDGIEDVENMENIEDIDFGLDDIADFDDYNDIDFTPDDDDIPPPDDYEEPHTKLQHHTQILNNNEFHFNEEDVEDEDDEEDDDAEFALYEPTRKIKFSILFSAGTQIAKYKVRELGAILTVAGDAKVTVKGASDSDGFSYCDPNRFPRYVRDGIMSGELYKNPNMKITDNSYFAITFFEIKNGETIKTETKKCVLNFDNITEEKIRIILKKAFDIHNS